MAPNIYLICKKNQTEIDWKFPVQTISNELQFEDLCLQPYPEQVDAILIVPELDWWGDDSPSFEGLKFIQRLRLIGKFSCPILVISEFDKRDLGYLQISNQIGFWADPAVKYSPLVEIFDKDSLSLFERCGDGLDEVLMTDVCESIYKAQGVIREIFHNLKGFIDDPNRVNTKEEIIARAKRYFRKFVRLFPEKESEIESLSKEFFNALIVSPAKNYHKIIASYQERILEFLDHKEEEISFPKDDLNPIEVLYIDDETAKCIQLSEILAGYGIKCHHTTNPFKGLQILEADKNNKIRAVICDYRFYNSQGIWHRMQGYQVINEIFKLSNILTVITLTNYHRGYLSRLAGNHLQRVIPFHKEDVFSPDLLKGIIPLIQTIIEQDHKNREIISGMGNFTEKQQIYYKKHLQSDDFLRWEKSASKIAFDFVKNASETQLLKDIPGYVIRQYKSHLKGKDEVKNLENFRNKLMGRRIALGLCQLRNSLNYNKTGLQEMWLYHYSALMMGLNKMHSEVSELHDLFNTHLRLSIAEGYHLDELDKYQLTLEEKNWLTNITPLLINGEDFIEPS